MKFLSFLVLLTWMCNSWMSTNAFSLWHVRPRRDDGTAEASAHTHIEDGRAVASGRGSDSSGQTSVHLRSRSELSETGVNAGSGGVATGDETAVETDSKVDADGGTLGAGSQAVGKARSENGNTVKVKTKTATDEKDNGVVRSMAVSRVVVKEKPENGTRKNRNRNRNRNNRNRNRKGRKGRKGKGRKNKWSTTTEAPTTESESESKMAGNAQAIASAMGSDSSSDAGAYLESAAEVSGTRANAGTGGEAWGNETEVETDSGATADGANLGAHSGGVVKVKHDNGTVVKTKTKTKTVTNERGVTKTIAVSKTIVKDKSNKTVSEKKRNRNRNRNKSGQNDREELTEEEGENPDENDSSGNNGQRNRNGRNRNRNRSRNRNKGRNRNGRNRGNGGQRNRNRGGGHRRRGMGARNYGSEMRSTEEDEIIYDEE